MTRSEIIVINYFIKESVELFLQRVHFLSPFVIII